VVFVAEYTFFEKSITVYFFEKKYHCDTFFQKSITVYLFLKKYTFFDGYSLAQEHVTGVHLCERR
jgi:hypothetical protein